MSTPGQRIRAAGTRRLLSVDGILIEADNVQRFKVLVRDVPPESEPFQIARGQGRCFVEVMAMRSDVQTPREIRTMVELPDGRTFNTLKIVETGDPDRVVWQCEAQRL